MKIANLMVAITSATLLGLSTLSESSLAQTRRIGNTYSQTGTDDTNVGAQFSLFDTTADGIQIIDGNPGNEDVGLFLLAVENFQSGNGRFTGLNSGNFAEAFKPNGELAFDLGTLEARFLEPTNTVLYTIFQSDSIDPVITYSLKASSASAFNLDRFQAVNSISYIIENNLLGDPNPTGSAALVTFASPLLGDVGGGAFFQRRIDEQVAAVPEPSMTLGALVALGAGGFLKRKLKQR